MPAKKNLLNKVEGIVKKLKPKKKKGVFSKIKLPKMRKEALLIPIAVIILALGGYFLKDKIFAAFVNGKPVLRWTLDRELEKQSGAKVLDFLITKKLILQEAKNQKITVAADDIDTEIKSLEDQFSSEGQSLDQLLAYQGLTRGELREQIMLQKIIDQIIAKDISVSEQEINDYIKENKQYLSKDKKEDEIKKEVEDQLKQQKLSEKTQEWLDGLKEKAKIIYLLDL